MNESRNWDTNAMKYYSAIKKNENLPFSITRMDLKGLMLNEVC